MSFLPNSFFSGMIHAATLLLPFAVVSCHGKSEVWIEDGKTPLARIGTEVLYQEDLTQAMPLALSPQDSAVFADRYIRNWAQDILFYENAKRNISDTRDMERLVENYRRSLYEHEYQRRLLQQKFSSAITDQEVENFYNDNKELFKLDGTVVKCLFLKMPAKSKDIARVRKLYTRMDDASFEELEKISIRNAARCEFHYDNWCSLDEIEILLPQHDTPVAGRLARDSHFEFSDEDNIYFLNVSEYVPKGGIEPLDNVRGRIRSLLVNSNEVGYMRSIKEELYRHALDNDKITFYKDIDNNEQE